MRKIFLMIVLFIFTYGSIIDAQDEKPVEFGWQREIIGNLNFTQNQFDNWTKGGENSWSWQLDIHAKFINNRQKFNWKNTGKISYGKTKAGKKSKMKNVPNKTPYATDIPIGIRNCAWKLFSKIRG